MNKEQNNVKNPRLRVWKKEVLERDGGKCLSCGGRTKAFVREILPSKSQPGLKYDVNNGICLCQDCMAELKQGDYVLHCRLLVMKSKCDNNQKDLV